MTRLLLLLLVAAPVRARGVAVSSPAVQGMTEEQRRRALLLTDLLLEEERIGEAEAFALDKFSADSDTASWTLRLARIRSMQERHAEAAEYYKRLLAERGDDPGLLMQLGQQSFAAGDLKTAKTAFLRVYGLSADPLVSFSLSEVEYSAGEEPEGRRWALEALKALKNAKDPREARLKLRLRSRLKWEDEFDGEFGKLYDLNAQDPEALAEWSGALLRADFPAAAKEPMDMLRERFPRARLRWRELEATRLRALGDRRGLRTHLLSSVCAHPDKPAFRYSLGEFDFKRRDWRCAEAAAEATLPYSGFAPAAREFLLETRWKGHHRAGPTWRLRTSDSARTVETGASYSGLPWRGRRLEIDASRGEYRRKSGGRRALLSGGRARLSNEAPNWVAGASLDARAGGGLTAAGPGVFGEWEPADSLRLEGEASAGRAWNDSIEAVLAGAKINEVEGALRWRPLHRFSMGAQAQSHRASVRSGGKAAQSVLVPEAAFTLTDVPLYLGLGYRYVILDARGDDAFFAALPLLRRARTHYAVLSFGKRRLEGRLRADGYVFNGHEPEEGRRWGRDDLTGLGLNLEYYAGRWMLGVNYEMTRENIAGVGGRSQSVRTVLEWRWEPGYRCPERCGDG